MKLQINRQYVPLLIELVQKELSELRREIKQHEVGIYEFKNGGYTIQLREKVAILDQALKRMVIAEQYAKSNRKSPSKEEIDQAENDLTS